jgi:hypothetical protein
MVCDIYVMCTGPIQPLTADLGVDVVYPHIENDVLFVCTVAANLLSSIIVWINYALRNTTTVR